MNMFMYEIDEKTLQDDIKFFKKCVVSVADHIIQCVMDGKLKEHESIAEYMEDLRDIEPGTIVRHVPLKWGMGDAYHFIRGSGRWDVLDRIRNECREDWLDVHSPLCNNMLFETDEILLHAVHVELFGERKINDYLLQQYMQSDHVGPDKVAGNWSRFEKYCINWEPLEAPRADESEPVVAA